MEFITTPGASRPLAPQAVVLLDPATGLPAASNPGLNAGVSREVN